MMNKYLIPGILVSMISSATLPALADSGSEDEVSEASSDFERDREEQLAKKLSKKELKEAKEEFDLVMDNYRDILSVLKKIRQQDDVNEGNMALKRLLPESTETYERMANSSELDDEEEDEDDTRTVDEIRAERALDQIKQENQESYKKLVASLNDEMERLDDSDLQSYELTRLLERLDDMVEDGEDDDDDES